MLDYLIIYHPPFFLLCLFAPLSLFAFPSSHFCLAYHHFPFVIPVRSSQFASPSSHSRLFSHFLFSPHPARPLLHSAAITTRGSVSIFPRPDNDASTHFKTFHCSFFALLFCLHEAERRPRSFLPREVSKKPAIQRRKREEEWKREGDGERERKREKEMVKESVQLAEIN